MNKKTNYYTYTDIETMVPNDRVTIVEGEMEAKCFHIENIMNKVDKVKEAYDKIHFLFRADGKAVRHEEDNNDPKLGVILASRRAQLKCLKQMARDIDALKDATADLLNYLLDVEDSIDYQSVKNALSVVKLVRKGRK